MDELYQSNKLFPISERDFLYSYEYLLDMKLTQFLLNELKSREAKILIFTFIISSIYVLSFPYPWGEGAPNPNIPVHTPQKESWQIPMWSGGTIPDENAYFQWAWIYYKTKKTYVPIEDIGLDKIQHFNFIIGNSSHNSYFMKIVVSQIEEKWESRFRNVTLVVYNGLNSGISNIHVDIMDKKTGDIIQGVTNESGKMKIGLHPGFYRANAYMDDKILSFDFTTNFPNLDYPILSYPSLENFSGGEATVKIHVDHYLNKNLSGVEIYSGRWKNSKPIGYTDKNGNFYFHAQTGKIYDITTIKRTYHISPPVGSVVVYVNGKYALANRWAPGYSYLIIPFYLSGLVNFITIFTFFIGSISAYILARRLYNKKIAFYSTFLFMVSSLGLMMLFSRGMADYATMAFSTFGIMLLIESIPKKKNEKIINPILGFLGGLSLGYSVIIRYSTVTVILAPIIYFVVRLIKNRKSVRFKKELLSFSFFLIALILMGLLLMSYNTALFGGPLNSGYQMSHRVEFTNGNATVETPKTNMFEKYFHPSIDAINNIFERILPQLFILLPTLFIAPLGFFLDWRKNRTWMQFFWGIPTILIYMQLTWVGHVPYEDMRYFLPILPPTAILSGFAINYMIDRNNKSLTLISLLLLLLLGFVSSFFAINWQLHRREFSGIMWRNPPIYVFLIPLIAYIIIYWCIVADWIKKKKLFN